LRGECIKKGKLFEDPFFAPSDKILRGSNKYKWLRPREIVSGPKFYVEGFSRFDVEQGEIGDCWLLAAISSLTQDEKLFFKVVHEDNSFDENYAGIFHFR
jgi:calpain, invertebrate